MARSVIRWMRVSVSGWEENSFWTLDAWEPDPPETFFSFSKDIAIPHGLRPECFRNS